MINSNNEKRSLVLPKWVEFKRAIQSKDLVVPRTSVFAINSFTKEQIKRQLDDFTTDPSVYKAADLMGAAIVINDLECANDMARYIMKNKGVEYPTLNLAKKILYHDKDGEKNSSNLEIESKISHFRKRTIKFQKNSINWIELARLYSIKGNKNKAKKAAIIALNLSPFNRYIVRSGVRFFVHIGELEAALYYTKKALSETSDPWIKALDINIRHRLKIGIGRPDKNLPKNPSHENLFHLSELFESYGMLELDSGNIKNAKKKFKLAWKNPCESVVRHGEWVIRNRLPTLSDTINFDLSNCPEALAWHSFFNFDIETALEKAIEWEFIEPYSASPYLLTSHSYSLIGNHEKAAESSIRGLNANPDHINLTNNLCYSLIKLGRLANAKDLLKYLSSKIPQNDLPFYKATSGLFEFKSGNIEKGRQLYIEAAVTCKQKNDKRNYANALLNHAIAEIESRPQKLSETVKLALNESEKFKNDPTIFFLRKELKKEIRLKKQ